jgi:hypothetical protein
MVHVLLGVFVNVLKYERRRPSPAPAVKSQGDDKRGDKEV